LWVLKNARFHKIIIHNTGHFNIKSKFLKLWVIKKTVNLGIVCLSLIGFIPFAIRSLLFNNSLRDRVGVFEVKGSLILYWNLGWLLKRSLHIIIYSIIHIIVIQSVIENILCVSHISLILRSKNIILHWRICSIIIVIIILKYIIILWRLILFIGKYIIVISKNIVSRLLLLLLKLLRIIICKNIWSRLLIGSISKLKKKKKMKIKWKILFFFL
jgi:hypothetical protein